MLQESVTSKQVFISYSQIDLEASNILRLELERAGLSVFHDKNSIRTGDRWLDQLGKALSNCRAFVVLIGQNGIERWVGAEVDVALNLHLSSHNTTERILIFPVLLKEAKPESLPPFLSLFQYEDWTYTEPLPDRLIHAIKEHSILLNTHLIFKGCPFLGLNTFSRKDAKLFFGRSEETLKALSFLGDQQQTNPDSLYKNGGTAYHRWLQIEGNSGVGKSSIVNAGMLPMIERGALWARTGFDHWRILGPMMPGKNPLEKLAETLESSFIENPEERDISKREKSLRENNKALAHIIRQFKEPSNRTAFLLIIDQFEELLTFSDVTERKQFDALLAHALQDIECPLFLITTVRIDFLHHFELIPNLAHLDNKICKRYFLPAISEKGLQEVIEQPARLANLKVNEVSTAILNDAKDEVGALPLVENALFILWEEQRKNKLGKLSGEYYRQENGIAGMLSKEADRLIARIEEEAQPNGKQAALELLFHLTRINDNGRHSRQRILREDAIYIAGNGNTIVGECILRMLSGERLLNSSVTGSYNSAMRLVTVEQEQEQHYVDLIHETLVRSRNKNAMTGELIGYWPTLFKYIEENRDRDLHRQQLKLISEKWNNSNGLGRLLHLAYFGIRNYNNLRIPADSLEGRFLKSSKRIRSGLMFLLIVLMVFISESFYWMLKHELPLDMTITRQYYRLGYTSFPELVSIPTGSFLMGEQDKTYISELKGELRNNFGIPNKKIQITSPFYLGKYEVTYDQYDYYVWKQHQSNKNNLKFPDTASGGRGNQPVININWYEATAYTAWLSSQIGLSCRLPTEAEWEFAARANTSTGYMWSNDIGEDNANCNACGSDWDGEQPAPVGSFKPNEFGLYDMSGNVWEWTCSKWSDKFDGQEQQCTGIENNEPRVRRGGSYDNDPEFIRSSTRGSTIPSSRINPFGIRVLCSLSPIE